MKFKKLLFFIAMFILSYSCDQNIQNSINEDLRTYDKKLIQKDFSGVILIAKKDSIIFEKAYGMNNSEANVLNTTNTIFDICSLTKQFTGAAIMKLAMENKVSLNDNLLKYFDNVPNDKKNITLHNLLTHSSGLINAVGEDYDTISESEFLDKVFSSELVSSIGKEYHYSNIGYSLLTLIIEKVSEMTYEAFLNLEIFTPSKMSHTGYNIPDWNTQEVSNGFINGKVTKKPNKENWSDNGPYLNLKGNGGILSRASDLLLWSNAITDNIVLDKSATSKYLFPYILEYSEGNSYYGYGWVIENNNQENKLVWHNGGNGIYASDMRIYPQKEITIIVLCNKYEKYVFKITEELSNVIFNK